MLPRSLHSPSYSHSCWHDEQYFCEFTYIHTHIDHYTRVMLVIMPIFTQMFTQWPTSLVLGRWRLAELEYWWWWPSSLWLGWTPTWKNQLWMCEGQLWWRLFFSSFCDLWRWNEFSNSCSVIVKCICIACNRYVAYYSHSTPSLEVSFWSVFSYTTTGNQSPFISVTVNAFRLSFSLRLW